MMQTEVDIQNAQAKAGLRFQAPFALAQAKGEFVSGARANPFGGNIEAALAGKQSLYTQQATTRANVELGGVSDANVDLQLAQSERESARDQRTQSIKTIAGAAKIGAYGLGKYQAGKEPETPTQNQNWLDYNPDEDLETGVQTDYNFRRNDNPLV